MKKEVQKIIIEKDGNVYEFSGGQPGPDSVGTVEIIDGSVRSEDLSQEVTDKLQNTYVSGEEKLYLGGKPKEG